MTETTKEPFRALAGAAGDYIKRNGWTQGVFEDNTGAVCLTGACHAADRPSSPGVYVELAEYLCDVLGQPRSEWNDEPDRTAGEVIQLLYAISDGAI